MKHEVLISIVTSINIKDFNMVVSVQKIKVMAFCGKFPIRSKVCTCNKPIEQFI